MKRPIIHNKERERCADRARRRAELMRQLQTAMQGLGSFPPANFTTVTVAPPPNQTVQGDTQPWYELRDTAGRAM